MAARFQFLQTYTDYTTGCLRKEYTFLLQIYVIKVCTLRINTLYIEEFVNLLKLVAGHYHNRPRLDHCL